jgi:phage I-like protein
MNAVIAEFNRCGVDMVIDYEHQSLKGGEAPAAGWIKELEARENGIYGHVDWTDRAQKYIGSKEYRFLSPALLYQRETGRVIKIMNVSLTNLPRINNVEPIINKRGGDMDILKKLRKLLGLEEIAVDETVYTAVETAVNSQREVLAGLRGLAGLGDDAEPAKVLEAVKNKVKAAPAPDKGLAVIPNTVTEALGLSPGATEAEAVGAIQGLTQGSNQAGDLAAKVGALEANLAERDAKEAVAAAMTKGKITPEQQEWALDYAQNNLAGFLAYAKTAPQVIPVGKLPGGGSNSGGGNAGLGDVQVAINNMLGVDEELFKKRFPMQ